MSGDLNTLPLAGNVKVEEPTLDVSDAVVEDSAKHDAQYSEWMGKAAEMCGSDMRGDIDPTAKQAENLVPVADDLASQLGLENLEEMNSIIDEIDDAELERFDEESRHLNFTPEDVGMATSSGSYSPALEAMWNNIENCKLNVERVELAHEEAGELIMALESSRLIDQDLAKKLSDRIPGSLKNTNIKMFTRLPSAVGYKLAHEGSMAGKIILGGLVVAGSIYLIYKVLSWTIEGVKTIAKMIRRIRDRRKNFKKNHDKTNGETFNPEAVDLEKMAKALFDNPTEEVKAKMKAAGLQPVSLRDVKWCDTNDHKSLINPLLQSFISDVDGSTVSIFNELLEQLVEKTQESVGLMSDLLDGIVTIPGEELHAGTIKQGIEEELKYANDFISSLNIPITFSNNSNVERLKAVHEWLDNRLVPVQKAKLNKAPTVELIDELCSVRFAALNDDFAKKITDIRTTLDPKASNTVNSNDTSEQANVRKEIIKDITVAFMTLSNVVRSIYNHTVYLEQLITAEDKFMTQIGKFTA